MSDLNKVISCLQKIKGKNLGQNHDNLMIFLVKGYGCRPEIAENLIEEAFEANIVKSIIFSGNKSYRVVKTDSFDDATILVSDTQTRNSDNERSDDDTNAIMPEESNTENNTVEKREESISVLIENKFSSLIQSIEKRFHNIEDKIIGFQNINLPRNSVNPTTPGNNLYVELFKNRISDLNKDNSVSIHRNNVHALAIEMYKVANSMPREIMNEVFKLKGNTHYNLRHTSQFPVDPIHSVYNGVESASYLGPKIWEQIPSEIRNKESLEGFKREIKK